MTRRRAKGTISAAGIDRVCRRHVRVANRYTASLLGLCSPRPTGAKSRYGTEPMIRGIFVLLTMAVLALAVSLPLCVVGIFHASQRAGSIASWIWGRGVCAVCGIRVDVIGANHVSGDGPCFLVGNHQSAIDIPVLLDVLGGRIRFLAKASLFRVPLWGWALGQYGHVRVHRSSPRATLAGVEAMLARIKRKPVSLVAFPEGTRSPDGALLPFRPGTMKICQRAGLPIVPFSINGTHAVQPRGRFRVRPGRVRLVFGEPIGVEEMARVSTVDLCERVRSEVARQLGVEVDPKQGPEVPESALERA